MPGQPTAGDWVGPLYRCSRCGTAASDVTCRPGSDRSAGVDGLAFAAMLAACTRYRTSRWGCDAFRGTNRGWSTRPGGRGVRGAGGGVMLPQAWLDQTDPRRDVTQWQTLNRHGPRWASPAATPVGSAHSRGTSSKVSVTEAEVSPVPAVAATMSMPATTTCPCLCHVPSPASTRPRSSPHPMQPPPLLDQGPQTLMQLGQPLQPFRPPLLARPLPVPLEAGDPMLDVAGLLPQALEVLGQLVPVHPPHASERGRGVSGRRPGPGVRPYLPPVNSGW